jgi:Predicted membrane protein
MSSDREFKPLVYRCPICGEKTTFGSHFCTGEAAKRPRRDWGQIAKRLGIALVGLILIAATLWDMIGVASLYFMGAAAIAIAVFLIVRRDKPEEGEGNEPSDSSRPRA